MPRITELFVILFAVTAAAQQRAIEIAPFPGTLDGSRCVAIAEGPDRRLWFGHLEHLQCHDGSQVKDVELCDEARDRCRPTLRGMTTTTDGALWVGTDRGIWRVAPGQLQATLVPGTEPWQVRGLVAKPGGGVMVRTPQGLGQVREGAPPNPVVTPGNGTIPTGLVASPTRIWAWTRSGLWTAQGPQDPLDWQEQSAPPGGVVAAMSDGDDLVCVTNTGVFRVPPRGPVNALAMDASLGSTQCIVADGSRFWLCDLDRIRSLPRSGGALREVVLFSRGQLSKGPTIHSMEVDRQGLLWFATASGVQRAATPVGIDNWLVAPVLPTDRVTAMAEGPDGGAVLGTELGWLLKGDHDAWQPIALPWQPTKARKSPIKALQYRRDGTLFLGTMQHGLWQLRDGTFQQIGQAEGICGVRALALGTEDSVWITHDKGNAWHLHADGRIDTVPLWTSRPEIAAVPCTLHRDDLGTIWLGSYREGLSRHGPEAGRFLGHGNPWPDDAVMNVFSAPGGRPLWATSAVGLWQIDPVDGSRRMLRPTARGDAVRSAAVAPDGSLWLAMRSQLMHLDPDSCHAQTLSPRSGAHPLGYSFRCKLSRTNGELWFGAAGGYTCVTPQAASVASSNVVMTGVRVQVAGASRTLAPGPNPLVELGADEGPLTLVPTLIDRSLDEPPPYEVILRDPLSKQLQQSGDGTFPRLPPGHYDASITVALPTGSVRTFPIGHVGVLAHPSRWPLALAAVAACTLAAALAWRRLREKRARTSRRVTIGRLIDAQGQVLDETLDIAFLAVSCAEECFRRSRVPHASVWMYATGGNRRLLLAEFGLQRHEAAWRARRCIAKGLAVRDSWWLLSENEHQDLVLCLHTADSLKFEVLLHDLQNVNAPLLDGLELAAAPLLSALRKQTWIARLEADYAATSSRIEADAHDIRSPLTTLRMCAFDLTARVTNHADQQLVDTAAMIADAAEQVIASIERMVRHTHHTSPLHLRRTDPLAALRTRIKTLAPIAERKRVELELVLPPTGGHANLDAAWFDRVVDNVVGNAVKYSPTGSKVLVHGLVTEDAFIFHVDDEGPGFLPSERESVFLPGMTGSAQPTSGEPKTGMGLWIARQAMHSMGGRLWIGTKPGPGARVSLALPRHAQDDGAS